MRSLASAAIVSSCLSFSFFISAIVASSFDGFDDSILCKISEKYNYELIIWSDMFFRSWKNEKNGVPNCEISNEDIDTLSKFSCKLINCLFAVLFYQYLGLDSIAI